MPLFYFHTYLVSFPTLQKNKCLNNGIDLRYHSQPQLPPLIGRINNDTLHLTMKIQFWSIGKAHEAYVKAGIESFSKRIAHYYPVEWVILPVPRNAGMLSEMDLRKKEGETVLSWLQKGDYLVALDEKGKILNSVELAALLQQRSNESIKRLIFLIGGAYGLDESVLKKADFKWSLSKLTFPHQLVRLILTEQIYRACSINRNEKYHHG